MPMVGLDVPKDEVDMLFDSWDPDGAPAASVRGAPSRWWMPPLWRPDLLVIRKHLEA